MLDKTEISGFKRWLKINRPELKHSSMHLYLLCSISNHGYDQVRPIVERYVEQYRESLSQTPTRRNSRRTSTLVSQAIDNTPTEPIDWQLVIEAFETENPILIEIVTEMYSISEGHLITYEIIRGNPDILKIRDIANVDILGGKIRDTSSKIYRLHEIFTSDLNDTNKKKLLEFVGDKLITERCQKLISLQCEYVERYHMPLFSLFMHVWGE